MSIQYVKRTPKFLQKAVAELKGPTIDDKRARPEEAKPGGRTARDEELDDEFDELSVAQLVDEKGQALDGEAVKGYRRFLEGKVEEREQEREAEAEDEARQRRAAAEEEKRKKKEEDSQLRSVDQIEEEGGKILFRKSSSQASGGRKRPHNAGRGGERGGWSRDAASDQKDKHKKSCLLSFDEEV